MKAAAAVALTVCAAWCAGCVQRTISITSEPEGALVWVNDIEVGRTPVEVDFTFYGNYDVRVRLEGYEPLVTSRKARAPWYEYPGVDLVAEMLPMTIRSDIHWHFELEPVAERVDPEAAERELLERARELRGELSGETDEGDGQG